MVRSPETRYAARPICPFYRLPQLRPVTALSAEERRPNCIALNSGEPISAEQARTLCRSGAFPTCQRFQLAGATSRTSTQAPPPTTPDETLGRRLLSSAVWVIGIPTAITLLIILALWITENV